MFPRVLASSRDKAVNRHVTDSGTVENSAIRVLASAWDVVLPSGVGAMMFREQAEKCRKQADEFAGRPEAPFLLRVASVFEELASEPAPHVRAHRPSETERDTARLVF
jgi:hypothetical protein